jgi:hypothetical protein
MIHISRYLNKTFTEETTIFKMEKYCGCIAFEDEAKHHLLRKTKKKGMEKMNRAPVNCVTHLWRLL